MPTALEEEEVPDALVYHKDVFGIPQTNMYPDAWIELAKRDKTVIFVFYLTSDTDDHVVFTLPLSQKPTLTPDQLLVRLPSIQTQLADVWGVTIPITEMSNANDYIDRLDEDTYFSIVQDLVVANVVARASVKTLSDQEKIYGLDFIQYATSVVVNTIPQLRYVAVRLMENVPRLLLFLYRDTAHETSVLLN